MKIALRLFSSWVNTSIASAGISVLAMVQIIKMEYCSNSANEESRAFINFCLHLVGWLCMGLSLAITLLVVFFTLAGTASSLLGGFQLNLWLPPVCLLPLFWCVFPYATFYIIIAFSNIYSLLHHRRGT